jgi:hypothetical protein
MIRLLPSLFAALTVLIPAALPGQASELFPAGRHAELREEIVYTPHDPPDPDPAPAPDQNEPFDLDDYRRPLIIGISTVLLAGFGLLAYRLLRDLGYLRSATPTEAPPVRATVAELDEATAMADGIPPSLLGRAEAEGEYTAAIRLLYLDILKKLQDGGHIRYRRDYSNRDYRRQLSGSTYGADFTQVTGLYERFWYGAYPLDRLTYRASRRHFTELIETLSRGATV